MRAPALIAEVTTVPADCQWTATPNSTTDITLLTSNKGTGPGQISYVLNPNTVTFTRDYTIAIAGLSGVNPPAVHRVHQASR